MVYRCQQMANVGQQPHLRRNASLRLSVNANRPLAGECNLIFVCYSMLMLTRYLVAAILQRTVGFGTVILVTAMARGATHTMVSVGLRTASSVAGRGVCAIAVLACNIETFHYEPGG